MKKIIVLAILFASSGNIASAATLDDLWAGTASFIPHQKMSWISENPTNVVVVNDTWYMFSRKNLPDSSIAGCTGLGVYALQVRSSGDKGKTWSEPVIVADPRLTPGTPYCSYVDSGAYYSSETGWKVLSQCLSKNNGTPTWNMCAFSTSSSNPMTTLQAQSNNPVVRTSDLWKRICAKPGSGCENRTVTEEGTPKFVSFKNGYFYVTFHGFELATGRGYVGMAKTKDFTTWITDDSDLPGIPVFTVKDCSNSDCVGGGAASVLSTPNYTYLLTETPSISIACVPGQNWPGTLYRAQGGVARTGGWESYPKNALVASPTRSNSVGCDVQYTNFIKDGDETYLMVTYQGGATEWFPTALFKLVPSSSNFSKIYFDDALISVLDMLAETPYTSPATTVDPTTSISVRPSTISSGGIYTYLEYSSTNARYCDVYKNGARVWKNAPLSKSGAPSDWGDSGKYTSQTTWAIKCYNTAGEMSESSATLSIAGQVAVPEAPTFNSSCSQQPNGTYNLTMTWSPVAGATNYPLRIKGPSLATNQGVRSIVEPSGTVSVIGDGAAGDAAPGSSASSFTYTGVSAGTYDYWGHAWNSAGWSSLTNTKKQVECKAPAVMEPQVACTAIVGYLERGDNDADAADQTNGEVAKLQQFLVSKGLLTTTVFGFFGEGTYNAVKAFQGQNGISQTGTVGPLTRAKISSVSGCGTSSVVVTQTSTYEGPVSSTNGALVCTQLTRDLAPRADDGAVNSVTGGEVEKLQRFLVAKGLLTTSLFGYYGTATTNAVRQFQTQNGIESIGTVGPVTRAAIASTSGCVAPTPAPVVSVPAEPVFTNASCTLEASGTYKVTLAWNPVPGATSYPMRLKNSTGVTTIIGNPPSDTYNGQSVPAAPTATTYTFSVAASGDYEYWGHAWNSAGWSTHANRTLRCVAQQTPTPTITSLSPTSGLPGSSFTINGSGFAATGNQVYMDYIAGANSWRSFGTYPSSNGTSITVTVPTSDGCPIYRSGGVGCAAPQSLTPGVHTVTVNSSVGTNIAPDTSRVSNTVPFTVTAECNSNQTLVNGACQNITVPYTCSNGTSVQIPAGTPTSSYSSYCPTSVAPTISSFDATPSSVVLGQSTSLSWSTSNATGGCTVNGASATSPISRTPTVTGVTTYTLTCNGASGTTPATRTVSVTATAPLAPTGDLSAPQGTSCVIAVGASSCSTSLSWSITNGASGATTQVTRNVGSPSTISSSSSGYNQPITLSYGTTNVTLTHNNSTLDQLTFTTACPTTAPWNNSICAAPTVPTPTAALTVPSCTIASGASSCTSLVSWTSMNLTTTPTVKQDVNLVSNAGSNTGTSRTLTYGSGAVNTFTFSHNGSTLDTKTGTASCVTGTTWNGSRCVEPTVIVGPPTVSVTSSAYNSVTISYANLPKSSEAVLLELPIPSSRLYWSASLVQDVFNQNVSKVLTDNYTAQPAGVATYTFSNLNLKTSKYKIRIIPTGTATSRMNVTGTATDTIVDSAEFSVIAGVLGVSTVCVDLPYNMFRGYESNSVTNLQNFLVDRGFLEGNATGFYGDKTVASVKEYQVSKGLPATGMVYDFTRASIKADSCQ